MLFGLGLRRGEALGLTWQDVDFGGATLHVRQQVKRVQRTSGGTDLIVATPKTRSSTRWLLMPDIVSAALTAHRACVEANGGAANPDDFVFTTSTGAPVDPANVYHRMRRIAEKVGLGRVTVHMARHTALTVMARAGVRPSQIQAVAGHADPRVALAFYTHLTAPSDQLHASGALNQALSPTDSTEGTKSA